MSRSFLTSATLSALIIAPALAQQAGGSYPNPTDAIPTPKAPGMTQNLPPNADQRAVSASQAAMPMASDILAETLQGLTVYTTRTDVALKTDTTVMPDGKVRTDSTVKTDANGKPVVTNTLPNSVPNPAPNSAPNTMPGQPMGESRTLTKAELKAMTDKAQNIGEVNDLLIGMDGKVRHAIIDVGGFLGVGERPVTVAWTDLHIVKTNEGDVVAFIDKSKAELNAMPQYSAPAKK